MSQPAHMSDAGVVTALVTVPIWWPAFNAYGQIALLIVGLVIGCLRVIALVRELRRK